MSPWAWLLLAGTAEVAWSQSIEPTEGFTRAGATVLCVLLALTAIYPLSMAIRELPVGTAYVVFTGIGGLGALGLGVLVSGDDLTALRALGGLLVIVGVATLRAAA